MNKNRISLLLPITIAILLPGINFLSHNTDWPILSYNSLIRWIWSSVILYILWYALDWSSKRVSILQRFILNFLIIVIAIIVFIGCTILIFHVPTVVKYQLVIKIAFASILFLIIQFALRTNKNLGKLQIEKEQALAEVYKIQLQELRTRIDPHFLFNSLNTLRSMVRNGDANSDRFILNLSNIYRKILKVKDQTITKLLDELELVDAYLELMQERNRDGVVVKKDISQNSMSYSLPTLSLQTIIENCFKHNKVSKLEPLIIEISTNEIGEILIKNNLIPKISIIEKSGMGIENIAKSYRLLNVNDGINVEKTDTHFIVTLKLIK